MSDIQWKEPPVRKARSSHDSFVKALMANPGKWALWRESVSPATPSMVKAGRYKVFANPSEWEFETERVEPVLFAGKPQPRVNVYARFVGES